MLPDNTTLSSFDEVIRVRLKKPEVRGGLWRGVKHELLVSEMINKIWEMFRLDTQQILEERYWLGRGGADLAVSWKMENNVFHTFKKECNGIKDYREYIITPFFPTIGLTASNSGRGRLTWFVGFIVSDLTYTYPITYDSWHGSKYTTSFDLEKEVETAFKIWNKSLLKWGMKVWNACNNLKSHTQENVLLFLTKLCKEGIGSYGRLSAAMEVYSETKSIYLAFQELMKSSPCRTHQANQIQFLWTLLNEFGYPLSLRWARELLHKHLLPKVAALPA